MKNYSSPHKKNSTLLLPWQPGTRYLSGSQEVTRRCCSLLASLWNFIARGATSIILPSLFYTWLHTTDQPVFKKSSEVWMTAQQIFLECTIFLRGFVKSVIGCITAWLCWSFLNEYWNAKEALFAKAKKNEYASTGIWYGPGLKAQVWLLHFAYEIKISKWS